MPRRSPCNSESTVEYGGQPVTDLDSDVDSDTGIGEASESDDEEDKICSPEVQDGDEDTEDGPETSESDDDEDFDMGGDRDYASRLPIISVHSHGP